MPETPVEPAPVPPVEAGSRRTGVVLVVVLCLFAIVSSIAVRVVMNVLDEEWADEYAAACAGLRTWLDGDRTPEDLVALRGATQDKWPEVYALDAEGDLVGDELGARRTLAEECG